MFGVEKVQISKDDWHFRWLKFVHFVKVVQFEHFDYDNNRLVKKGAVLAPKSICPYFWLLMWSFVVVMVASAFALLGLGLLVYGALWLVVIIGHNVRDTLLIVGFVGAILVASLILGYLIAKGIHRPYRAPKPHKPGIFETYFKAKKENICPLVEYT